MIIHLMPDPDALRTAIAENIQLSAECDQLAESVGLLQLENALLRRQLDAAADDAARPMRWAFFELLRGRHEQSSVD